MKVILLKDVSKVGQRYEIKEIASGYALNFLIPRGLAKPATESEIRKLEQLKSEHKKTEEKQAAEFKEITKNISSQKIVIESKVNEKGHLFKGLHEDDLSGAIKKQKGIEIPAAQIHLKKPIKEIGDHEVEVKGPGGMNAKIIFSVVALK